MSTNDNERQPPVDRQRTDVDIVCVGFVVRVPLCGMKMREALTVPGIEIRGYARPHPGPLPRGEGEQITVPGKLGGVGCNRRRFALRAESGNGTECVHIGQTREQLLPLLGERAGVRTGHSQINFCLLPSQSEPPHVGCYNVERTMSE
jgi:hypothetical protein